jgi:hypothetical protein
MRPQPISDRRSHACSRDQEGIMIRSTTSALRLALVVAAVSIFARGIAAQCSFPACARDERYDAASATCNRGPAPVTLALSHRPATCREGERLDRATGMCVLNACADRRCEAIALCTGDSRYGGSHRDAEGTYGVCLSGPNWLGHMSHAIRRCPAGFTLNEARGVCVGNCAPPAPAPLPDLVIRRVFLRAVAGGPVVTRVPRGRSYFACFEVANVGLAASGAFQVGGGGLGVSTAPRQAHASLAPRAARTGCLTYPTTPSPGRYRIGIEADSRRTVRETREDNNAATLEVVVVP